MPRKPLAIAAAVVLFVEAIGFVLLHLTLGRIVSGQSMSLAGLDPDAMALSTYVLGGVSGLYLAACGAVLLRAALSDIAPGRVGRILLIACAGLHVLLGALTVGLVGWTAFAVMMLIFVLVVYCLMAYGKRAVVVSDQAAATTP